MELRQLRYFVKAAETLNFSEAAKALFIAQSTLSQQIKQLEDEFGVLLFYRSNHVLSLTEAGEELLSYAVQTICSAETCVSRINDLKQVFTGKLNIGVTYSFSPILTETLVDFMKAHPQVSLNISYKPMAELMDMLERREVDFVLAFRPLQRKEEIESHVLFDNYLAAIVKDSHTLAAKNSITLSDLSKFDLALPTKGLQARNAFDWHLQHNNARMEAKVELNEVNILLELIRKSNLVTILAEATIHNASGVKAIRIDVPSNEMDGCVHMLKNTYRKHSALEFIRMLKESQAIKERIKGWFE